MKQYKYCPKCKKEKNENDFNKNKNDPEKYGRYCKKCCSEWKRKSEITTLSKAYTIYGNKCNNKYCEINDPIVLQFHHKQKRSKNETGIAIARRIVRNNKKLSNIDLLCANCHIHANIRDGTSKQRILKGYYHINGKKCKKCQLWKPKTDFYKQKQSKDSLFPCCKECDKRRKEK